MEQENKINELSLKAIPDLYGKNFFIPDYQRGYRWGTRQVEQLMNDLCNFFDERGKGDFYCLQPIVVKELTEGEKATYDLHSDTDDNRWYEVIDGQQRLTTIRIIFALEHLLDSDNDERFNIHYQTRDNLSGFFDRMKRDDNDKYKIVVDDECSLDIDSWHILQAASFIMLLGETTPLRNREMHLDWKLEVGSKSANIASESAKEPVQSANFAQGLPPKCKNCTLEEIAVLRVIQQDPSAQQKFVAKEIGKSERTVKTITARLTELGIIQA